MLKAQCVLLYALTCVYRSLLNSVEWSLYYISSDLVPLTTQIGDMVNNQQFDLFGYVGFVLVDIFDKLADKIPGEWIVVNLRQIGIQ